VPFFVRGGAAILRGSGTELDLVPPVVGQWLTVAVPPHTLANKTATLYAALAPSDYTDGQTTRTAAAHLEAGLPPAELKLTNAFSRVAGDVFPGLAAIWREAEAACGRAFQLSGAGPALFTLAASRADAQALVHVVEGLGLTAYATRTVAHARASVSPGSRLQA
jgi:4-diphosphocytidyl-2-C-methyl-D-erythritol kinase